MTPPRFVLATIFYDLRSLGYEIVEYITNNNNLRRTTADELRYLSGVKNIDDEFLNEYRKAAEVYR